LNYSWQIAIVFAFAFASIDWFWLPLLLIRRNNLLLGDGKMPTFAKFWLPKCRVAHLAVLQMPTRINAIDG
jgi:hypothetical protein